MNSKIKPQFAAIVLAAGHGTRMKSKKSKVLHPIGGIPMIQRTVEILEQANPSQIIIVANPTNIKEIQRLLGSRAHYILQKKPLGTADAAGIGLKLAKSTVKNVAVIYGDDSAFYKSPTVKKVFQKHLDSVSQMTFVTLIVEDPKGLGRIVRKGGKLTAIVEEKNATDKQKKIKEVNNGLYFFDQGYLKRNLQKLTPAAITGEIYLTDLVALGLKNKDKLETYKLETSREWHGVNTPIELAKANIRLNKNIHFMGIGGSGASAVAQIAKAYGFKVDGCDKSLNSPYIDQSDFPIKKGHSKKHLKGKSVLVISPAIVIADPKNPEISFAKEKGIPTITWQEFQGQILQENKFTVAVAGAYGKSTTTAMIASIFADQQMDPTCEIGARILSWDANFRIGKSKYYICEADEYNDNFLNYQPDITVVLNTKWEHPDYFKTKKDLLESYGKFIQNIKSDGTLVIDEESLKLLGKKIKSDIKIFKIGSFGSINLKIIGDFRKENVNAALTLASTLNLDILKAKNTLIKFTGLARRLELKGTIDGVKIYDDYAVQPYTIEKTANALSAKYPDKKLALVLEPHTFSRIKTFFKDFVAALNNIHSDKILITDVYAAREKGDRKKLSQKLAQSLGSRAQYSGNLQSTAAYLKKHLGNFDLICSMGAGDVYKLYDLVKK